MRAALLVLLAACLHQSRAALPVVLWHGMGDSCCSEGSLGKIVTLLEEQLPNTTVISLKFGETVVGDIESGYFANANNLVAQACETIANHSDFQNGYNAIGFSQGGQFLRAVAQRCPTPGMKNLISLGGQHQGIYGLPHCGDVEGFYCNYIRQLLDDGAYVGWIQDSLIQAQYWHDPWDHDGYRNYSIFMAEINNVKIDHVNPDYATNLNALDKLVLVKFGNDSMVVPKESSWFGFYQRNSNDIVIPYQETDVYINDTIGLQQLVRDNKIDFIELEGDHLEFSLSWFTEEIIKKYLS